MIRSAYPLTCLKITPHQKNKKIKCISIKMTAFQVHSITICLHSQHFCNSTSAISHVILNVGSVMPPALLNPLPLATIAYVIYEIVE